MKPLISLLLLSLAMNASAASQSALTQKSHGKEQTFKGAWFTIRYPAGFQVRPSQKSATGPGYDSAFFTSPDQTVQFYVFSPQWSGSPTDYQLDPRREVLVDQRTEKTTQGGRISVTHWETVRARNGSYERSWEDKTSSDNTRQVFGIRYRDGKSLMLYRSHYLAFKKSLQQFAD